jgi:predicted DsbA family dithiol-disulfide isomerase
MNIEVWSDVVCPFCYIGKRHLEAALATFPHRDQVTITWRSFELDPQTSVHEEHTMIEVLQAKYGRSLEHVEGMLAHVTSMAAQAGLTFHLRAARPSNTLKAHRLIHLAAAHGLQDQAKERLMQAYFSETQSLNDDQTLQALMVEIGLPAEAVTGVLSSDTYTDAVRADQQAAREMGVSGVPFFVFNQRYAVSGAQPVEVFSQVLQQAWDETQAAPVAEAASCAEESCAI